MSADVPIASPSKRWFLKSFVLSAIFGLMGFIVFAGGILYEEFRLLRIEEHRSRMGTIIGYENISPRPMYAHAPADWFHEDGEKTLLWAGWHDGRHEWFHIDRGDLIREQVSEPMGRDSIQAIDYPIAESAGGPRWEKLPCEHLVAGIELKGVTVVYPLRILEKCEVVNDFIADLPVLVTFSPFVPTGEAISVFETVLDGHRITMGLSGYFSARRPVLYDRGTKSLWLEKDGAMISVAGRYKGSSLRRVATMVPTAWSEWISRHPESRLIVGADRTKLRPEL